ncbi:hypothetical protein BCR34DRAFT_275221 [Clohesyomyces aquaticus]|uniref:RING-type domain-containing protein n=1 Tax=Clohesyomyces aquaticus TaxID=1231657 RepID=A0A1Y1ZSB4_9PLEO|nr:hypothetical protein BCR34DRAFT_275221 [Clohesyomyces aquaticus]
MDDTDDMETWKLCWEVSRLFQIQRPTGKDAPSFADNFCIGCRTKTEPWSSKYRSEFVQVAAQCTTEGHLKTLKDSDADVCMRCNQDFVMKVVKREQGCPEEGCRRVLTVDESTVVKRLEGKGLLAAKFLSLISRYEAFECLLHMDTAPLSLAPKFSAQENCNHEPNICSKGLKEVMKDAVYDGRLLDVRCPDTDCRALYSNKDIRIAMSKETFVEYNRKLGLRELQKDPNFRWCQEKGCGNGQVTQQRSGQLEWQCVLCKAWNCFGCFPTTCERHKKGNAQEAVNKKKIEETTKKCPSRGCARPIEYRGGCAHMTCRESVGNGCGTEFCWNCKLIWKRISGRGKLIAIHLESCRFRKPWSTPAARPALDNTEYAVGWDEDPGYDTSLDKELWLPDYQR